MRPLRPTKAVLKLLRENDGLKTTIVVLRREIEDKQGAVGRLELLVRERLQRIDDLAYKLDVTRLQLARLDLQNEILIAMLQAPAAWRCS